MRIFLGLIEKSQKKRPATTPGKCFLFLYCCHEAKIPGSSQTSKLNPFSRTVTKTDDAGEEEGLEGAAAEKSDKDDNGEEDVANSPNSLHALLRSLNVMRIS